MPRRSERTTLFLIMAPMVLGVALLGIWVSVSAMIGNVHLARFSSQILSIVSMARDMARDFKTNDEHATRVLYERLVRSGVIEVVFPEDVNQRGIVNPWGEAGTVAIFLSQRQMRVRSKLTPVMCRRFLLASQAAASLGLVRVEAHDDSTYSGRRQIYDQNLGPTIEKKDIEAGCGMDKKVELALTFTLD